MIRAAKAMTSAEIMKRSLPRQMVRAMFTVISFSGDAQLPFGRIGKALKSLFDCARGDWLRVSEALLHFWQ